MGYVFKKLADSWTALTDAEKKALFEGTNYLKPSVDEIKSLGDFKCLVYSDNSDAKFKLTGVPNDQLVLPSGLISMLSFDGINSISLANTVSTNGIIKMAVTLDKSIYYTYDSTIRDKILLTAGDVVFDVSNKTMSVEPFTNFAKRKAVNNKLNTTDPQYGLCLKTYAAYRDWETQSG